MLTQGKLVVIMIFMHTRLSGKFTALPINPDEKIKPDLQSDDTTFSIDGQDYKDYVMIQDPEKQKYVEKEMQDLETNFYDKGFTLKYFENMSDGLVRDQLIHYYNVCLNEFSKHIKQDDLIQENLIVLGILIEILLEKEIGKFDVSPTVLCDIYHKEIRKEPHKLKLFRDMLATGEAIVRKLDKADYTRYIKNKRNANKGKRKKRRR